MDYYLEKLHLLIVAHCVNWIWDSRSEHCTRTQTESPELVKFIITNGRAQGHRCKGWILRKVLGWANREWGPQLFLYFFSPWKSQLENPQPMLVFITRGCCLDWAWQAYLSTHLMPLFLSSGKKGVKTCLCGNCLFKAIIPRLAP